VDVVVLLYDRMTALDAVGPYEVLCRLPGATVTFAGVRRGPVVTDSGRLRLIAEAALDEVPSPGMILVPGGPHAPVEPGPIGDWLRAADATSRWTTSVCTGSLALAAAGLLTGRRATSHWLAVPDLASFGAVPVAGERVVRDGKYVTSAGVSAGIDLALTVAAAVAGPVVAQTIQLAVEYDPQPPFRAGSPATAPPAIVAGLRADRHLVLDP
jgi:transcriptional regulator GlxA family with amidase domain